MCMGILLVCMSVCHVHVTPVCGDQKRASDSLELKLQMFVSFLCGFWDSNPGPLKEPSVLLTAKLSL